MTDYEKISSIKDILDKAKDDNKKIEILYQFKKIIIEGRSGMLDNMQKELIPLGIEIDESYLKKIRETGNYVMEWIDAEIKNLESKLSLTSSTIKSPVNKIGFKNRELKEQCKIIAKDIKLIKGQELTQKDIDNVCAILESKGYSNVNKKSVGTTLREKLGYKKEKL